MVRCRGLNLAMSLHFWISTVVDLESQISTSKREDPVAVLLILVQIREVEIRATQLGSVEVILEVGSQLILG